MVEENKEPGAAGFFCSGCLSRTTHLVVERKTGFRCEGCGARTSWCPVRKCRHMAVAPQRKSETKTPKAWRLCAEHRGDIAAFSKADMRLRDLRDWSGLFERETMDVRKTLKRTLTVASLAGVAGVGSVAVAPVLAARLGARGLLGAASTGTSIQSLSGAALTKASLAYFGGGAVAAGGGGMAVGTGVIGLAGAAVGTARGLAVANAYFGDIKDYDLREVRSGDRRRRPLLFVNGFLQRKDAQFDDWERATRARFAGAPAYGVKWESGRLAKLGAGLASVSASAAVSARQRLKKVPGLPALATAFRVQELLDNPWHVALRKAGQVGQLTAEILARFSGPHAVAEAPRQQTEPQQGGEQAAPPPRLTAAPEVN